MYFFKRRGFLVVFSVFFFSLFCLLWYFSSCFLILFLFHEKSTISFQLGQFLSMFPQFRGSYFKKWISPPFYFSKRCRTRLNATNVSSKKIYFIFTRLQKIANPISRHTTRRGPAQRLSPQRCPDRNWLIGLTSRPFPCAFAKVGGP